jgi:ryanodine receptor 2
MLIEHNLRFFFSISFSFLQYLACLSTSSSNDKLSFDVGLQEHSQGEACWWTVHPANKQRSEGEKVRVGDDLILVSVATERYLVSKIWLTVN